MITLYLERHSPLSEEILDNVRRLVLAHQVVYREERDKVRQTLPRDLRSPALIDDEDVFQGGEKIACAPRRARALPRGVVAVPDGRLLLQPEW